MHYPKLIPTGSFGSTPKVHSVLLVGQTTAAPEHPPPPELGLRIMPPDANFRELRQHEVRRITLLGTLVNKGIKRGPEDGLLQRRVLGDLFITRSTVV